MPAVFIRQQFVISQVVVMEREKRDEVVEKLESLENSRKMWLLDASQHSPLGRFPIEFSELCGTGFSPYKDLAHVETQVQRTLITRLQL